MRAIAKFIVKKRAVFYILFAALCVVCALCIPKVEVEYDISTYLPKETDTKHALDIMEKEFTTYGSTTVMVKDIPYGEAEKLHVKISGLDGVRLFQFENTEAYYKDGCAKFSITYSGKDKDEISETAYKETLKILDGSGYKYVIPAPLINTYAQTLASEMVVIIAISAAVILLVLLFTSKSFAEIIAFPIVFVVAAVLNMGTNWWLGKISFVSNTVCIILQLALAIDYAIILCHRFTEEKDKSMGSAEDAMITALAKAIPEIASSSLTTISGLVALMFMQLGLGFDLGMVLAKSIVCSLLTVFLLMPGLLLLVSKLMDKSRHKSFVPKMRFWGRGVVKARYALILVFAGLFAAGAIVSRRIDYVYSTESIDTSDPMPTVVAQRETQAVFGVDNMFAILVPAGDYQKEREVLDLVSKEDIINSALGMANVQYGGVYLVDRIDAAGFAELAGIKPFMSGVLFNAYAQANGGDTTPRLIDLLHYLVANKSDPMLVGSRQMIERVEPVLEAAEGQLVSKNHSRLVFNIDRAIESPEAFALIEKLTPEVKAIYPDAIFAGKTMSAYDLNASFSYDNLLITMLTVAFIYIILAFTFRSWGIPVVLVLAIQGAIFINFSLPVIIHQNLFFFTYLIVSAIQMGATIDYAILVTNRFRSLKTRMEKREAMTEAVSGAFPTVFTSGTIMCVAGFLVGGLTSDPLIASMGTFLGTGTLISIAIVLTVLPALLYTLDGLLEKTVIKPRHPMKYVKTPNPSVPIYKNRA